MKEHDKKLKESCPEDNLEMDVVEITEICEKENLNSSEIATSPYKKSKLTEIIEEKVLKIEKAEVFSTQTQQEEYYDFLSLSDDFQLVVREPTWQELEKLEEEKLFSQIENMNSSFKNKNKKDFLTAVTDLFSGISSGSSGSGLLNLKPGVDKSKRSLSFDQMENFDFSVSENSLVSSTSTNFTNLSNYNLENIITQNLSLSDEIVKLMVIGDKCVGKSYFIEKLCTGAALINNLANLKCLNNNALNSQNLHAENNYKPTQSLEIKRFIFNANMNKFIKIELLDTNVNILSSDLAKTYYKICNGFVLICDVTNFESIKFVEKEIEKLINLNYSDSSLILFANIRENVNTNQFYRNLSYLSSMEEKFNIKKNFINIHEYYFEKDFNLQKFLNICLIKKSGRGHKNSNSGKKMNLNSSRSKFTENLSQGTKSLKMNLDSTYEISYIRDLSASPKSKKQNCLIF